MAGFELCRCVAGFCAPACSNPQPLPAPALGAAARSGVWDGERGCPWGSATLGAKRRCGVLPCASACWRVWGHSRPQAEEGPLVPPILGVAQGARCLQKVSWDHGHSLCPISCCASVSPSCTPLPLASTQGHCCRLGDGLAPRIRGDHPREPFPGLCTQLCGCPKSLLALLWAAAGQEKDRHLTSPPCQMIASGCYLLLSTPSNTTIQTAVKSGRVLGFCMCPWARCSYKRAVAGTHPVPGWPRTLQVSATFALRKQPQKLLEPWAAPPSHWKPPPGDSRVLYLSLGTWL